MKVISIISFIFFGLISNSSATNNWTTSNYIEGYNVNTLECIHIDIFSSTVIVYENPIYRCGTITEFKFINLN